MSLTSPKACFFVLRVEIHSPAQPSLLPPGVLRGLLNGILGWQRVVGRWHDGFMISEDSSGPGECKGIASKTQLLAQKKCFFLLRQGARYLY